MNGSDVQDWLNRYIAAWRSNEPDQIGELFSTDAVYRYNPYDESRWVRGREAIIAAWLDDEDEPDAWEAGYEPYAIDGERAVATGFSRYFATSDEPEKTYYTAFLLSFDADMRCAEFTEYG